MMNIKNISVNEISEALSGYTNIIDEAFKQYFSETDIRYIQLFDSMRYSIFSGGKRIRPAITLMFSRLFGGTDEKAVPYACAVEMIHTYSLIHDDLPCMDNDDIRRGKPSNHKQFGEATALLSGDTLLTYAFEVCASNPYVSDKSIRNAVRALSSGAGAFGMTGGQMIDLMYSGTDEQVKAKKDFSFDDLEYMHRLKTGALIKTAALLGYYAACDDHDEKIINDITAYAYNIGLAFQIEDDILDVEGSDEFGKPAGSDEKNGKITVLSYMSIDEARKLAEKLTCEAVEAVSGYQGNDELSSLAVYLLTRKK